MNRYLTLILTILLSSCANNIEYIDERITVKNHHLDDGTIPHKTLSSKPIKVPKHLIENRIEAIAVIKYDVEKNGTSSNASIIYSRPAGSLDQALIDNAKTWRFRPATKNGEKLVTKNIISLSAFCLTDRDIQSTQKEVACGDEAEKTRIYELLKEKAIRIYVP